MLDFAANVRRENYGLSFSQLYSQPMFRYRLSSFALFLAIVCIGLGWYVDRSRLAEELDATKDLTMLKVSILAEKYLYWSPSHYIRNDYLQLESILSPRVGEFTGIISAQFCNSPWRISHGTHPALECISR